ncbi:MAG: ATP-binding protein [Butyrivibrio sp.]|nr:ATP-binding protein [Butyrivibrio sp.]
MELSIEAKTENLYTVLAFIDEQIEKAAPPMKVQMQIEVAVEEIFVNISQYAYAPNTGMAVIRVDLADDPAEIRISFIDSGVPYNPLAKDDPDVTLSVEERQIGGLGIYMVKKSMDDIFYEYKDGKNCLTITKRI